MQGKPMIQLRQVIAFTLCASLVATVADAFAGISHRRCQYVRCCRPTCQANSRTAEPRIGPPDILEIEVRNGGPSSGRPELAGAYLVNVGGAIDLGKYGTIQVEGMTESEARLAVQRCLTRPSGAANVRLHIKNDSTKVCYVCIHGTAVNGIWRLPLTGNETVLNVLSKVRELKASSIRKVYLARLPFGSGSEPVYHSIDWAAISQGANMITNYCVLPNDRVFIQTE